MMEKIDIFLSEEDLKNISGGQLIEKELKINDELATVKLAIDQDSDGSVTEPSEKPEAIRKFGSTQINQKNIPGGNENIL